MRYLKNIPVVALIVIATFFHWATFILDFAGRITALQDLDSFVALAQKWVQKHPALGTFVVPALLLVVALAWLVFPYFWPTLKDRLSRKQIEIVFPNECNLEHKVGRPWKRSSTPLLSGQPRPTNKSLHKFYIGIRNCNTQRTLRNVKVLADCQKYGSLFSEYLLCERTSTDSADISPDMTDYFLLGQGIDGSDAGLFSPQIDPPAVYLDFFTQMESKPYIGFVVFGSQHRPCLLKNNDIPLTITVFADDTPPERHKFNLDLRDRIVLTST